MRRRLLIITVALAALAAAAWLMALLLGVSVKVEISHPPTMDAPILPAWLEERRAALGLTSTPNVAIWLAAAAALLAALIVMLGRRKR